MNKTTRERYWKRLNNRIPLIGERLRRHAVEALVRDRSPEAVQILVKAALQESEWARAAGLEGLRYLAREGHTEAREALCSLAYKEQCPGAREIVVAEGYAPAEARKRALFY